MRDNVPSSFQEPVREVAGRLKVYSDRPDFTPVPNANGANIVETAAVAIGNTVRRFAFRSTDMSHFYVTEFTPTENTISLNPTYTSHPMPDGSSPSENYRSISAFGDTVWIAQNGRVYRMRWGESWELVGDYRYQNPGGTVIPMISIAAISEDEYVASIVVSGQYEVDRCEICYSFSPTIFGGAGPFIKAYWRGMLPRHTSKARVAAIKSGKLIYVYCDDYAKQKPVRVELAVFSELSYDIASGAAKPILPLDAMDEEGLFSIGTASNFRGNIFLTGIFKRQYGPDYSVYLAGPREFMFGRDFIIPGADLRPVTILDLGGDFVWLDDPITSYRTPIRGPFGMDANYIVLDALEFNAEFVLNGADRLSVSLPNAYAETYADEIVPGARAELEVISNGEEYKLGTFGIDMVDANETDETKTFSAECSSSAVKRLLDWQSDTFFDYRGQAEAHGEPGDLTKLVRVAGQWNTDDGLLMESLNEDGILYTTQPASSGGMIKARFSNVPERYGFVGVGLNYGEETLAQTAARLNKKIEEVTAKDRGKWGVFAIYDRNGSNPVLRIMSYNTIRRGPNPDGTGEKTPGDYENPWAQILLVGVTHNSSSVTLQMTYQDGYVDVTVGEGDTAVTYSSAITNMVEAQEANSDHYGRGALFFCNCTGYKMCYPFGSDSNIVPLYRYEDQILEYGVPLNNPAMPSSGKVKVDSEIINYSGMVYDKNKMTTDLQWLSGRIAMQTTSDFNPTGAEVAFAQTRWNTYIVLEFDSNLPPDIYLTSIRFWVKKVNYPTDGLRVSVYSGDGLKHGNTRAPLGTLITDGPVSIEDISSTGGVVSCTFGTPVRVVSGTKYRILIARAKDRNHPDPNNYYAFKLVPAVWGVETYIFKEEEPDEQFLQNGELPFQLYAKSEVPGQEYGLVVKYDAQAGLPTAPASAYANPPNYYTTYYNNCAAVIVDGAGKGNCYRIVRCDRITDPANDIFILYVDREINRWLDDTTKIRITGSLYGLSRGQDGTLVAAHGDKRKVNVLPPGWTEGGRGKYFEYFSSDEDLAVAEVAAEIARKAGVKDVHIANRGGVYDPEQGEMFIDGVSQNMILTIDYEDRSEDLTVTFYNGMVEQLSITLGSQLVVYSRSGANLVKLGRGVLGPRNLLNVKVRISLYDDHISVWSGGRLHFASVLPAPITWTRVGIRSKTASYSGRPLIMVPEAGTRVETFVMDMGKSGNQLMQTLIGEKRAFYRDDRHGGLRIFTERIAVPGVYTRAAAYRRGHVERGLATRLLLEGGEIVETSDIGTLKVYGSLFRNQNFYEINSLSDVQYFADITYEEMRMSLQPRLVDGAADPVVEPGDQMTVRKSDGSDEIIVVDSVSHMMRVQDEEAVYDMQINGRRK